MLFQDEGLFAIDCLLFCLLFTARAEKRRADVEWTKKTQLELLERDRKKFEQKLNLHLRKACLSGPCWGIRKP